VYFFAINDNNGKPERYVLMHENITERKLAEEAVRKSNELLSMFMKYSPIYAFIKEVTPTESRVLMASDNFIKMIGVSKENMIGKNMQELFPADLATQITKDDWNVASSGQMLEIDEELDGRYYHTIKFPIIYGDKNLLAGYTIDVTENKKTEEILKQNEEEITRQNGLFTSLLKNLTQGVFMVEVPSGKPLMANDAALKLLGRGILPDVTKNNLSEVYNAYKVDKNTLYPTAEMPIIKGMKGESSYIDDMLVVRPDGTETFLEIFGTPVINRQGQIWASLVSFSDITERKKAEVALSESEARFKTIFMKSPMGISLSDSLTGQILQANPRYAEIVGRTQEEVLTLNWMDITHPDDVQVDQEKNALLLQGTIPGYQMEKRYIHPDGSVIWVNMTIVPMSEELYDHPHNLCMIEDITDKKKYEMELIKAKERAEESDRLKSAFLANVSHEIRTPMNGIIGFAELLKEPDISGDDLHEYVGIIEKSGIRMLNIINDIIDISKIESGLMKMTITKTNIQEQVEFVYGFFKPEAEAKGLSLVLNSADINKEAFIYTDREKLYAIITNLVKNSIKYTKEGVIELGYNLKTNEGEPELMFFVKDTGIGIPKDRQDAVFERFIQAEVADTRSFQGAGLGLAITKAYVEMLGGQIGLESEEGKGSTFYFTLPSLCDSNPKPEEIGADGIVVNNSRELDLRILIAEDDEISSTLIEKGLRSVSKTVDKVKTGVEAVEFCHNHPDIDLILMDVQMPLMDGYTAVRKIREFNKNVVIFAQTAYALAGDREKAINAGCNDYITKPISKGLLLKLIYASFKIADGTSAKMVDGV
jgi:PAS domain S-box-containing protein